MPTDTAQWWFVVAAASILFFMIGFIVGSIRMYGRHMNGKLERVEQSPQNTATPSADKFSTLEARVTALEQRGLISLSLDPQTVAAAMESQSDA